MNVLSVFSCLPSMGVSSAPSMLIGAAILLLFGGLLVGVALSAARRRASIGLVVVVLGMMLVGFQPALPARAAPPDCPPPAPTLTFAGTWSGIVDFPVPVGFDPFSYPLTAVVTDDGTTAFATVDYPTLPCSAVWTQTARSGNTVTFKETINPPFNPLNCADLGVVTLTLSGAPLGSTLDWTYQYESGPGPFDQATVLYPVP